VTDATHLRLNLRLVLEARALGLPMVVVLNMSDMARRQGIVIDKAAQRRCWACPWWRAWACIRTAPRNCWPGWTAMPPTSSRLPRWKAVRKPAGHNSRAGCWPCTSRWPPSCAAVQEPPVDNQRDDRIDAVVLHPLWGTLLLLVTLFLMFQAVFSWAEP
jgi:ferrous iron transport protein B